MSKEKAALAGVWAGLVDTLVTLGALLASRSSVILSDFLKTFLEFVAVLLAWYAIRRIQRGNRQQYDYGLDKLENLSSLLVGLLMLVCLLVIITSAVRNILHPSHITGVGVWVSLISQVVYGLVNSALGLKNRRLAQVDASPVLEAQARLFLTKTMANLFILLSLVFSLVLGRFHWALFIDPAASLVIAGSILLAAMGILTSSFYDLLDRTLEETNQIKILRELALHFDEYEALHGIRSRRSGSQVFVEIFLEFDPEKKVGEVQAAIQRLRQSLEEKIGGSHVTIALATEKVA